jgi:WD40 repeat protein
MTKDLIGPNVMDLERDYRDLLAVLEARGEAPEELARLREHHRFVERSAHHLGQTPAALWTLAHAEPENSTVRRGAVAFEGAGRKRGRPWFRLLNPLEQAMDAARLRTLVGHNSLVNAVALAPDGRHALSGSDDQTLIWWDLDTGQPIRILRGHTGGITAVALSPGGRHVLSGSEDRTLVWWDLGSGQPIHTLRGHASRVLAVMVSPDGRHALSGSWDRTLRWWDLLSQECLAVFPCPHTLRSCALSSDGRTVVAGLGDGRVLFFRPEET